MAGRCLFHSSFEVLVPDITNWVFMGILEAAIEIAFRAMFSGTPLISKMILPGVTTAAQYAWDPFPEPIRVSAGLAVTGLSGKIRTQIFPPRLTFRVIARRPASICLAVIQAGSSAWRAYLPKQIRFPRLAFPVILPLCCLGNFIRLGPANNIDIDIVTGE